jgi:sugar O-acyltransferase (sialic acid O-acetyltransferase NeuD family)
MTRVIIVCAGGQGAVVADILQRAGDAGSSVTAIGFVDDTPALQGTHVLDLPVLGTIASLPHLEHDAVVVAIGDNRARRALTEHLLASGERLVSAVHPRASVAPSATIDEGAMVSAGALLLPRAVVRRGVIINTNASVDHDSVVDDFAHVSAGVTVGARVQIGSEALLALGSAVISGRSVGARTTIGAGAVVVRDIPDDVVAWGVPARVVTRQSPAGTSGS